MERTGRREPRLKVTGIDSLQRKELVQEIGQSVIEKVGHFCHLNYFNCSISLVTILRHSEEGACTGNRPVCY